MPLRDHFHPPLFPGRSWELFHSRWANSIGDALNQLLPPRYVSEVLTRLGSDVAADVAELETLDAPDKEGNGSPGGVAVQAYAPPATALVMPAVFPDELEVEVRDQADGSRLVAVIELVSPRNKDRPDARHAFAGKCAAYLQRGLGLIVVDSVTGRHFNLHNEMVRLLDQGEPFLLPKDVFLYAAASRPIRRQEADQIDLWPVPLALGATLPTLPLALKGARPVPVDLEATYTEACRRSRL